MNTPRFLRWSIATNPPGWLILLAGAAILALRRPDQITNPQLWAEDGIFFFQAREMGLRAFFVELAGYSQLTPRLIAAAAQLVDPAWVPQVFVGAALATTLYVMSRALSSRCPLPRRGWVALSIVLVPDAAEVLLNANNVQWILACGGVLLLLSHDPVRRGEWTHDVIAAIVMGLTGPFSVLLTPFFAARAFLRRTRASAVLAGIVAACATLQAINILLHPQPPPPNPTLDPYAMVAFPGLRIVGGLLLGPWLPAKIPWAIAAALTLGLVVAIALLVWRAGETRRVRAMLGLLFAAILASTFYRCWHSMPVLCEPSGASRYVFPLQLILCWLLLALTRDRDAWIRWTCAIAAVWMVAINVPRLRIAPVPDKRWADYAPKLRAGEEVTIPLNPDGWTFTFPARKP
jgi:hypothetical protein